MDSCLFFSAVFIELKTVPIHFRLYITVHINVTMLNMSKLFNNSKNIENLGVLMQTSNLLEQINKGK